MKKPDDHIPLKILAAGCAPRLLALLRGAAGSFPCEWILLPASGSLTGAIRGHRPALVLLAEGTDRPALLRALGRIRALPDAPRAIVVSPRKTIKDPLACISRGADDALASGELHRLAYHLAALRRRGNPLPGISGKRSAAEGASAAPPGCLRGAVRWRADGTITSITPEAAHLLAAEAAAQSGDSLSMRASPETRAISARALAGIDILRPETTYEQTFRNGSGHPRRVRWRVRGIFGRNATLREYEAEFSDGEREEQARRSAQLERDRMLVDLSPDAIVLHSRGKFLFINPAGVQLFGARSAAEIIGTSILDVVHPDDRASVRKRLAVLQEEHPPVPAREERFLRRDGAVIIAEVSSSPLQFQGEPSVLLIARDITGRKRAEEELRKNSGRIRALLDAIPDRLYRVTGEGTLVDFQSREDAAEPSRESAPPLPAGAAARLRDAAAAARETGRIQAFEYAQEGAEGAEQWEMRLVPAGGDEIIALARDVTDRRHAEDFLRMDARRFRGLFEHAPLGYQSLDTRGCVREVNRAWCDLLGYRAGEVIGRPFADFLSGDSARVIDRLLEAAAGGGEIHAVECEVVANSGRRLMVSINGRAIAEENAGGALIHCILTDITEQKRTEGALRHSEQQYRNLFDNVNDAIFIIDPVTELIQEANQSACDLYGLEYNALLRMSMKQFTKDIGRGEEQILRILREGKTKNFETIHFRADGVPLNILVNASTIEYNGQIRLLTVHRDITERKRAEEALRNSEIRYRAFIANSSEGIWCYETDQPIPIGLPAEEQVRLFFENGYLRECNQVFARQYGFEDPLDFLGRRLGEFLAAGNPASLAYLSAFVRSGYRLVNAESREVDREGNERIFLNNLVGIIENNCLVRAWGTQQDITQRKKTEEQVALLAHAIRSVSECIAVADMRGRIIFANDALLATLGYTLEDLRGCPLSILQTAPDPPVPSDPAPAIPKSRNPEEARYRTREGREIPVLLSTTLVRDDAGNPVASISVAIDITERKRSEAALRESEERYRSLVENIKDIYYILGREGRLKYGSPNLFEHTGYTYEELRAITPLRIVARADRRRIRDFYDQAVAAGIVDATCTFRVRRKNGEEAWVEQTTRIIRDAAGRVTEFRSVVRDISERKRSEERLARLNETFLRFGTDPNENINLLVQLCGEQLQASTALYNRIRDGKLQTLGRWNVPASFRLVDAPEGHVCYDVIRNESNHPVIIRDLHLSSYASTDPNVLGYGLKTYVGQAVSFGGTHVGSLCTLYREDYIPSADDLKILGIVASAVGVEEERKRAQEKITYALKGAEKAEKLKTAFIANMSHEIRTPLNTIMGYSTVIQESLSDRIKSFESEYFESVQRGCERLMRTVDEILNISRLEAGDVTLNMGRVDIPSLLEKLVRDLRPVAESKLIHLLFRNEKGPLVIEADQYYLSQALSNLIDNGIKYTDKGFVDVRLYGEDQGRVCIDVADTGIGIGEDFLPHIFEPYTQEEVEYSRAYEGLGLGLALVKKYLEMHGASIAVRSTKGIGTIFTITFQQ